MKGPKGPRNKIKQMLVIDGHPESLFVKRSNTYYSFKYNGKIELLGKVGKKAIDILCQIPGVEIIEEKKERCHAIKISHAQSISKKGNHTIIIVAAPDEEKLRDNIITVKYQLKMRGVESTERCLWTCEIDKKDKIPEVRKKKGMIKQNNHIDNYIVTEQKNNSQMKPKTKELKEMVIRMGIGAESLREVEKT